MSKNGTPVVGKGARVVVSPSEIPAEQPMRRRKVSGSRRFMSLLSLDRSFHTKNISNRKRIMHIAQEQTINDRSKIASNLLRNLTYRLPEKRFLRGEPGGS